MRHYQQLTYEYELREDGCFHVTLNSYSSLWQDQGVAPKFCTMNLKEFEKGDSGANEFLFICLSSIAPVKPRSWLPAKPVYLGKSVKDCVGGFIAKYKQLTRGGIFA
jgi:hypothetical protein